MGATVHGDEQAADPYLVIHYTFDEDPGKKAKDQSTFGNDGSVTEGTYLEEVLGRSGVLRLSGGRSHIGVSVTESLKFGGDISIEMWVRKNDLDKPLDSLWSWGRSLHLHGHKGPVVEYSNDGDRVRTKLTTDKNFLTDQWMHVALVVEYPRTRLYQDGQLVSDVYIPFKAIGSDNRTRLIGSKCLIDIDELRVYRRALTAMEIQSHAQGKEVAPVSSEDLAVETHWYEKTVTLRLSCKGSDYSGHTVNMALQHGDYTEAASPQSAALAESTTGSGRYVATIEFPLAGLENKSLDATARIIDSSGKIVKTIYRHVNVRKPEWVYTREGYSDKVLPPWTPVQAKTNQDGTVEVSVWDRKHIFGATLFPQQIQAKGSDLLTAPITLKGRVDGKDITWEKGSVKLLKVSEKAALLQQVGNNNAAKLTINTNLEFDGYMILDCEVTALRDLTFEALTLDIPLHTKHATLCFGSNVYPEKKDPQIPMSVLHIGAVRGDLAFRFSPSVWLGDEERGLTWQAETNEDWHYSDKQKAIEILPRGETTTFRANWINVPTKLAKGQTLHYKFALQATPVKPMLRDSWDLRIIRSDPYVGSFKGNPDLNLPDRWIKVDHEKKDRIFSVFVDELNLTEGGPGRKPALEYYKDAGVRHLWISATDNWPWPWPTNKTYGRRLKRLINHAHASGLKIYSYLIHERMPTNVPEYDIHGQHMTNRPFKAYEAVVGFCAKSMALQDAIIYNFARRMDEYGDDGVYLDGTGVHMKNCQNMAHGCGYIARKETTGSHGTIAFDQTDRGSSGKDGKIHPTYPVFADRELLKRMYTVVKTRRPDGVLDVHSWYYNSAGLAYADILWSGEQWWHLRGKGVKYVSAELSLDTFRAGFMGHQFGVPAEMLSYRLLGNNEKNSQVAAISLLHDVPVRVRVQDTEYFDIMSRLWKARDEFDAKHAEKLFYWNNQDYVTVSPDKCYATLFKHATNGVWAFISNLDREAKTVSVQLDLAKLGLAGQKLEVFDVLTNKPVAMSNQGTLSVELGSEQWIYVWLRKTKQE